MLHLSADIAEAVSTYGYSAILLFSFVEADIALALGGVAVHEGFLNARGVVAASLVAAIVTDLAWFWGIRSPWGRRLGRWRHLAAAGERCRVFAERRPRLLVFVGRFLYGFRSAIAIAVSSTHIPFRSFALSYFAGLATWFLVVGGLGYFVGGAILPALIALRRFHIGAALIVVFALGWIVHAVLTRIRTTVEEKAKIAVGGREVKRKKVKVKRKKFGNRKAASAA